LVYNKCVPFECNLNNPMPTKLDRVQVLFQKELFRKLKIIAKIERRSLSKMVGSIVADALQSTKYQSLLSKAKADDLESKICEIRLLIKEIFKSKSSNQSDIDEISKLKQIEDILSLILESSKAELEEDLLVEDALKPVSEKVVKELQSGTDYKLVKLREMLNRIKKNEDINN